jgi:hypothetical protein
MSLSSQIKPISYLKAHAAAIARLSCNFPRKSLLERDIVSVHRVSVSRSSGIQG